MPNHVTNNLTVSGPENDLLRFHQSIDFDRTKDTSGIIRAFLPFPEELKGKEITNANGEVIGTSFTDEGYAWCLDNWGTKWGDYDTCMTYEPYERVDSGGEWVVGYEFQSAWCPANEAFVSISKMFPSLMFVVSWEEEGCQSMGGFVCRNGVFADYSPDDMPEYPYSEHGDNDDEVSDFYDRWYLLMSVATSYAFSRFLAEERIVAKRRVKEAV